MIGIIDCNIGNIGSLMNAFSYLGGSASVVSDPKQLDNYSGLVLPGVGAFDAAMSSIEATGFSAALKAYACSDRPILGICIGLQILCNGSDEGVLPGLGLVNGRVVNLRSLGCVGKIPHVGFNSIHRISGESKFLSEMSEQDFYFVHSFALSVIDADAHPAVAYTEYEGAEFIAALQSDNIFATQFHLEKSGEAGLALLRQFLSCSKSV